MKKNLNVSSICSRYFADDNDHVFLPIGVNLCFVRNDAEMPEAEVLKQYRCWMEKFAANHGNYIRIWAGVPFFNVMPDRAGELDERNLEHIRTIVRWAEELHIKLKFTLEHFRCTVPGGGPPSFLQPVYAPFAKNMREYCESEECRKFYLQKAQAIADAVGDSPALAVIELWNEIDAIGPVYGYVGEWSRYMIERLHAMFPRQMVVQNLGSFSEPDGYRIYDYLCSMEQNDFLQVHRYYDPGAALDICRAPMDVLAAEAVKELLARCPGKPAVLAETGAVEANHCRSSDWNASDTEGIMLHDALFAPFFAGSAGCGQFWHWDHIYISKHDLWYHFGLFAEAVKGIDPVRERFVPFHTETRRLRVYGLRGQTMNLLWLRDKASSWQRELMEKCPAETVSGEWLYLDTPGKIDCYLPWEKRHVEVDAAGSRIQLPEFRRSAVLRILKTI